MSRQSTAIGGGGLHSFTCDSCWGGFNTLSATSWAEAELQAAREGWRFEGHSMSARDYCGRCS